MSRYSIPVATEIEIKNGGIRNESMKRFGTPIGAEPGSVSEKLGLAAIGTPFPGRHRDLLGLPPVVAVVWPGWLDGSVKKLQPIRVVLISPDPSAATQNSRSAPSRRSNTLLRHT